MIFKGLTGVLVFLFAAGVLSGVMAEDSEMFSPSVGIAKANRINAETAAFVARNNYEQQGQAAGLEHQRALARQDLELRARKAMVLEDIGTVLGLAGALSTIVLAFGASVYVASLGVARLRQMPLRSKGPGEHDHVPDQRGARVIPLPTRRTFLKTTLPDIGRPQSQT